MSWLRFVWLWFTTYTKGPSEEKIQRFIDANTMDYNG